MSHTLTNTGAIKVNINSISNGVNVWPKAGEANIGIVAYNNISSFFDALASGKQGIVGQGSFVVDWTGGHATVPTGANLRGCGIGASILTDADATILQIAGVSTVQDLSVECTSAIAGVGVYVATGANAELILVRGKSTGTSGIARGFYIYNSTAVLVNCEGYASGGATNRALWAEDAGGGTTVELRGGKYTGDVVSDQAGCTVKLYGPVITGSVTSLNSGVIKGWYFDSTGVKKSVNTQLDTAYGGTGQTTYTNGQLLIGNTGTTSLSKATLTAGSGISITNGAGTITIAASAAPAHYRKGTIPIFVTATTLRVSAGIFELNGTIYPFTSSTAAIDITAGASYIGGASLQGANKWLYVYTDGTNFLLYDQPPLDDTCSTTKIWTAQVNGNPAAGATSIPYDGAAGALTAGDIIRVWTDSTFSTVRGAWEVVTASATPMTVAANDVDAADNDYLTVVAGKPRYRQVSGTWYRYLGSLRLNAGQNMLKFYRDEDMCFYDDPPTDCRALSAGAATVYTDVSLSPYLPPIILTFFPDLRAVRATTTMALFAIPKGSTSARQIDVGGYASISSSVATAVCSPNQCIQYKVDNAATAGYIDVAGYRDVF